MFRLRGWRVEGVALGKAGIMGETLAKNAKRGEIKIRITIKIRIESQPVLPQPSGEAGSVVKTFY